MVWASVGASAALVAGTSVVGSAVVGPAVESPAVESPATLAPVVVTRAGLAGAGPDRSGGSSVVGYGTTATVAPVTSANQVGSGRATDPVVIGVAIGRPALGGWRQATPAAG